MLKFNALDFGKFGALKRVRAASNRLKMMPGIIN